MAQFLPAYNYMMDSEDRLRKYLPVADPVRVKPGDPPVVAAAKQTAQAISGINSYTWPADFERILSCGPAARAYAVQQFYQSKYWTPLLLAQMNDQTVANCMLDDGVNQGDGTAVKLLQAAVNVVWTANTSGPGPLYLDEDGAMGPLTVAGVNSCAAASLLLAFEMRRIADYERIGGPDVAAWVARAKRWRGMAG